MSSKTTERDAEVQRSFQLGAMSRGELEDECDRCDIEWSKHESSEELRAKLLDK